eukprot:7968500-Prorocentrum_lima.AAC.1
MTLAVINGVDTIVPAIIETELINPHVADVGVMLSVGIKELEAVCTLIARVLRDNGFLTIH